MGTAGPNDPNARRDTIATIAARAGGPALDSALIAFLAAESPIPGGAGGVWNHPAERIDGDDLEINDDGLLLIKTTGRYIVTLDVKAHADAGIVGNLQTHIGFDGAGTDVPDGSYAWWGNNRLTLALTPDFTTSGNVAFPEDRYAAGNLLTFDFDAIAADANKITLQTGTMLYVRRTA